MSDSAPPYDFRSPRLYLEESLGAHGTVTLPRAQAHYLAHVLRLRPDDAVLVFNGRDGEWSARIAAGKGRELDLHIERQTRPQQRAADLHYLFAPLKRARLDYMVQKAVEMGVSRLQPVMTRFCQAERVRTERMRANAIEAAEQCGILTIPEVCESQPLPRALAALDPDRLLIFCDENAPKSDPIAALAAADDAGGMAVLVGPEGGFSDDERSQLLRRNRTLRISLGPRILRADTAAVAVLALVQAVRGDWRAEARA